MPVETLLLSYVVCLIGGLSVIIAATELRRRRFAPKPSQDRIFRCEKCGFVYTDDPDVDRSRCSQCGETNEPVTGDRVGRASDRLEGEGDAFFLADGADLPVDTFGACGIPELELQIELPVHALSRHVRIELERAPMER